MKTFSPSFRLQKKHILMIIGFDLHFIHNTCINTHIFILLCPRVLLFQELMCSCIPAMTYPRPIPILHITWSLVTKGIPRSGRYSSRQACSSNFNSSCRTPAQTRRCISHGYTLSFPQANISYWSFVVVKNSCGGGKVQKNYCFFFLNRNIVAGRSKSTIYSV